VLPATSDQIVVAFTGASGAAYGVRLVEVLLSQGATVHLVVSPAADQVFARELELSLAGPLTPEKLCSSSIPWWKERAQIVSASPSGQLLTHGYQDYSAGIASGSFPTSGMVICPCSMGTLAAVAHGMSTNLIQRAADVHLKERRKLIVVPRETPLGLIQLENMRRLTEAGGVVLPAMPGLYHQPLTIMDLVDFVVTRICDQLGRPVKLTRRWGMDEPVDRDCTSRGQT
jgi:flavin prenyltransferase